VVLVNSWLKEHGHKVSQCVPTAKSTYKIGQIVLKRQQVS